MVIPVFTRVSLASISMIVFDLISGADASSVAFEMPKYKVELGFTQLKNWKSSKIEKIGDADVKSSRSPRQNFGPLPAGLPDVRALEADLRTTRQQLEEAGRDKAAMSESLRAMKAVVAEALEAMKRTSDEKAANEALEADLRSTRQRLAEADRDKAAMSQSVHAMQAAVAEALEATKRTDDEKAANQALEAHLRSTRQRLEDAGRDKAAASQSLRAMEATVSDRESKLKAAEAQTSLLVVSLAAAKRDAVAASKTKQDGDTAAARALEADLRSTRQRLEDAGRNNTATAQSLRTMQAAAVDREGKLKAAEARTADLSANLAAVRRDAIAASLIVKRTSDEKAAAAESLRAMQAALAEAAGKLKAAQAETVVLAGGLAAAKRDGMETLKRTSDDKTAAAQSLRALQAAVTDREGKLKAAEAQTAELTASLAAAKHDAIAALESTNKTVEGKTANRGLEADLRSTRLRLEDAGRDKAAMFQSLHTMQAAVAERDGKLKAAEAQSSVLTASLAAAKHDAIAASEKTKRTDDDKAALSQSLRTMQVAVANREGKLEAAEAQTAVLVAGLAVAKHDAVLASAATKQNFNDKAANLVLEADLRSTRRQLEEAGRDRAATGQSLRAMQAAVAEREGKLKAAEAQTAVLFASLAAAKHDAALVSATAKQAADEKAINSALQADLRSTRQQLEEADRDKAAMFQSLHTMQAAVAEREGKLKAAEAQTSVLTASLAAAKHDAALASESIKRTSDERNTKVSVETTSRREEANRDKAATSESLRAMQAAVADRESRLKAAEAQAVALIASLAAAKHDAVAVSKLTKQASVEKAANLALEADLRSTRQRLEEAGRDNAATSQSLRAMQAAVADRESRLKAAEAQTAVLTSSLAATKHGARVTPESTDRTAAKDKTVESAGTEKTLSDPLPSTGSNFGLLSDETPSNVVLQYRAGNRIARDKATSLQSILSTSGIVSTNVSKASNLPPGVHVVYYYKQDQMLARQVSKSVTSSEPTQKRSAQDQMPLPGTVEVSVGG